MEWQDVGAKIAKWAPELGATIGSVVPGVGTAAGGAIGLGIRALASAFGLTENVTPEQLDAAISQDPNAALTIKLANMNFLIEMRKLDIEELRANTEPYIEELRAKTVPWVDGLHKLGRQILNLFNIVATVWLMLDGKTITPEVVLLLGGPNVAYQLIKGKGGK